MDKLLPRFTQVDWPEVSGIKTARLRGLTGKGIRVAVLDTGIDADHEAFSQLTVNFRYIPHFEEHHMVADVRGFDTQGHGTHVAAIIAGRKNGIAPDVDLSVGAICESNSQKSGMVRFDRGLKWVFELFQGGEPAVLNLSIGLVNPPNHVVSEHKWQAWISLLRSTMLQLEQANVLVVASWMPTYQIPAELHEVLAVGALDNNLNRVDAGDYAFRQPDLMGFGQNVCSAAGRNNRGESLYTELTGSSQAAAYVTGIAAIWRQANPSLNVRRIRELMVENSLHLNDEDGKLESGLARFV